MTTLFSLLACTPTLDWREVRFEGAMQASDASPLTALLPCKPDRATREQTVAGERVSLSMMGCPAAGATFTLSRMVLKTPVKAPQVLAAWQAATLANTKTQANLMPSDKTPATQPETSPFKVPGASGWPAAARTNLSAAAAVEATQVAWFAQLAGPDIVLYQAAIYGAKDAKPLDAEAISPFFESLRLP
ncbi:MAG: hypothetical protein ABIT72_05585 [Burkholderiaceae bacterium]